MKSFGSVSLFLSGLNLERFINKLTANGVVILKFKRISYSKAECEIYDKDLTLFSLLASENKIELTQKKYNGFLNFLVFFKVHFGLLIGFGLCCVFSLFVFTRVWKVEVFCEENVKQEVVKLLEEKGVSVGKSINNIDANELQKYLLLNGENLSLVSITKRGTSLIINVKEKNISSVITQAFEPLVSRYGGVVEKINLTQGTLNVRVGDVIKSGDVLVEPYILNGEKKLEIEPKAEITIKTWCEGVVQFDEEGEVLTKTGKVLQKRYIELFGIRLGKEEKNVEFDYFEIDKNSKNICQNMLLPFKLIIERYSELSYQKESRKFEEVYDELSKKSNALAREKLDENMVVRNEKTSYTKIDSLYVVRTIIECDVCIS